MNLPQNDTTPGKSEQETAASWEWVFADNSLAMSDPMARLMGFDTPQERVSFDDFIRGVHPEDRKNLRNAIFQAYRTGKPFEEIYRIITASNTVNLLRSTGRVIADDDGQPISLFSTAESISDDTPLPQSSEQPLLLKLLYDGLPEGFITTDLEGKVLEANQAMCHLMGLSLDEIKLYELGSLSPLAGTMHDNLRQVIDEGEATFRAGASNKHGDELLLEFKGALADQDGAQFLYFFIQDVTERTQERDQLKRQNNTLRLLLDSAGDGIYAVDRMGNCTFLNRAGQELIGYSRQQVLGQNMFELIHDHKKNEDDEIIDYVSQVLTTGRPARMEEVLLWRKDGHSFPCELSSHPLIEGGQLIGAVAVFRDITRQHSLAMQLEYQASHDTLTGLINRSELLIRINRALNSARHEGRAHVLLFMDLDQFKVINDNSGHTAGDELLRNIADKMKYEIRRGDSLARLGGDEFGILLLNCELHVGEQIAEKFRKLVQDYRFFWEGEKYQLGVSIGVVAITSHSSSAATILSAADTACYSAKDHGRNQIRIYRPDDTGFLRRRGDMLWLGQINQALKEDRFHLYYQELKPLQGPKPGLHVEVLIKMDDMEGNHINPGTFLPAAERANLTPEIDRWVIRNVFAWMSRNRDRLDALESASINLSGHSLGDKSFLDFVIREFERYQLPKGKVCFEITETVAIANLVNAQHLFSTLSRMGCKFSLDDFGTGMSSYGYLKNLPVDYVKIDGIFVKDIINDPVDAALVQSITDIAHAMNIQTIAEFVESEEIFERVKNIGVDYAQGYHVGQSIPLDELPLDS